MKIAFLGDIALIGKYDLTKNSHAEKRLKQLAEKLAEYDYVIANLESPFTNKNKTLVCKSMHIKTSIVNVELLKYLHIDAVSLANNHSYDYGSKGIKDTISVLEKNCIEWFGVNSKYLIKEINGETISFSGFCCYSTNATGYNKNGENNGVNALTYEKVINQLDLDRDNDAFSIMSFHWGDEHTNYPKFEHIKLVEQIAKKKDSVICGHHPHVIQGVQKVNTSLVAYSLGNCLFDDCISITGDFVLKQNRNNKKSFILEVEVKNASITGHDCYGFKDEEEGLSFYDGSNELTEISEQLNHINNFKQYEELRKQQIDKVSNDKFGKHNFKWLKSRLNYYSLGAYIARKFLSRKYLIEKEKFIGNRDL